MLKTPDQFLSALSTSGLLTTLPQGLFLVDRQQKIVYWNPAAERILGYRAEEVLDQHCSILEGIPCGRSCGLYDDSVDKPIIGVRCTVRGKDGRRVDLAKSVDLLRDENGEIIGGVESFVDVSRMKDLERHLRRHVLDREQEVRRRTAQLESERSQLRAMLDAMSDLAYIASFDFRVEYMNRAMVEVFGNRVGENCFKAFHQRDARCPGCPFDAIREGRIVHRECTFPAINRTYDSIDTPVNSADGLSGKLSVFRDITERKEAEERLREANHELDAFVYTVSHDLRAPLTPIIGYAEFLEQNYRHVLNDEARKALFDIEAQGHRMMSLMEDLLVLSRVGRLKMSAEPVCAARVVERVGQDLGSTLAEKGLELKIGALPALRIPDTLLGELFSNLIGNAARYAGKEGGPIEIGSRKAGGRYQMFVRDHGPGIPQSEAPLIFNPFFRGENAGSISGTGIGLAIVRKIVRLFGGRIWVEETPGGGATFWMELSEDAQAPD